LAQFKIEALYRDIERLEARHKDLRSKLHTFQEQHMQKVEHVKTLQHNSKWWASIAKCYLEEAENRIEMDTQFMDQYLQVCLGLG
jgi:predicted RNase H-like nuclease (RuvC/YqgF family)